MEDDIKQKKKILGERFETFVLNFCVLPLLWICQFFFFFFFSTFFLKLVLFFENFALFLLKK